MRRMLAWLTVLGIGSCWFAPSILAVPPQYESPHVRPIGVRNDDILVVNTPDNRLSVFDWNAGNPLLVREVRVGLEPVSVTILDDRIAWVTNHLSDDISVVDYQLGVIEYSIVVGDEPANVVFVKDPAGDGSLWAAITLSQEDRVLFVDADYPYTTRASVTIPASDPRGIVASTDSTSVWVAAFASTNETTIVPNDELSTGPWQNLDPPLPPFDPPLNVALPDSLMPENGVIVRKIAGAWRDEQGGDWTSHVPWDLPDKDVFRIDVTSSPAITRTVKHVSTLLYDLTVDPRNDDVWVVSTEATSQVFFEPKLESTFSRNRISRIPNGSSIPVAHSLNDHIYGAGWPGTQSPLADRDDAVCIPNEVLFSQLSGAPELYVSAIGSQRLVVVDPATGDVTRRLAVPEGLTGLAESPGTLLLAVNRLTNEIQLVDPNTGLTGTPTAIGKSAFDPTPAQIKDGRRFLYTGSKSGHGTTACASCHPHADMDHLAWDLGNPAGTLSQLDSSDNEGVEVPPFHPLKGPMTTQTLRGLMDVGHLHWRGDKLDFTRFNPAFISLLGGDSLSTSEMADYEAFILSVAFPPNPWRNLANNPPTVLNGGNPTNGKVIFETHNDGFCTHCHRLPLGTNGLAIPLNLTSGFGNQPMKTPQLRNLYEKVGLDDVTGPNNKRGFGFIHNGRDPRLVDFLSHPETTLLPTQFADVEAFLLTFDTGTHGAVAQQVTVDTGIQSDLLRLARISGLRAAAEAGEIDLIVHGRTADGDRGWRWVGSGSGGTYQSDRMGEIWIHDQFIDDAVAGTTFYTFTGVPAGQGTRMALDRDEDGYYDLTEIDLSTDPADPASAPTVAVGTPGAQTLSALTRVTSAFPQPFRAATRLELYLPVASEAVVNVFDVRGRMVRHLASRWLDRGRQVLPWDGKDERGQDVAPGAYLVQLVTPHGRHSLKVIRLQ